MGMNDFALFSKKNGTFVVQNTSPQIKTIKIFNYPIPYGQTRDLLQIPGVSEADIRASLLKGELQHKILAKDIIVLSSDVDLLQFNTSQKNFLQGAGIINGLDTFSLNGISATDHETLKQLIHFVDEGPGDGFASGAYKETLPIRSAFPASMIWYIDATKSKKLIEKLITYNSNNFPITIVWNMYNFDGVTIVHSVTDTIVYSSGFESTRTRTIS